MSAKTKRNNTYAQIKIQPPLLVLIHVALAFLLQWFVPLPLPVPSVVQTAGFLLALLGFMFGLGALIAFRRARTTLDPHGPADRLVTFGIYRFTRNPIYLGFVFMLVGIPLNAGTYWGILLTPILVLLFDRLVIEREEGFLVHTFGEEYKDYRAKVRRWL